MEILFLGTSSGVPTQTRNVSATVLKKRSTKHWALIDCGEATQHQLLKTSLSLANLQVICISHIHGDHCYGLPGLVATASMNGRTEPLTIIAPIEIEQWLKSTLLLTQTTLSYDINFLDSENLTCFTTPDFSIDTAKLSHRVTSHAFIFIEQGIKASLDIHKIKKAGIPSGPLWGAIQRGEKIQYKGNLFESNHFLHALRRPRKVIIAGDNDTPEKLIPYIDNTHVLVHESTYTDMVSTKVGKGPQHSSAKLIAEFAEKNTLKHLILTHFSPRYQNEKIKNNDSIDDIRDEASAIYSGCLFTAQDYDCYHLSIKGEVSLLPR